MDEFYTMSTMSFFLTPDEIADLTGFKQSAAQVRYLRGQLGYKVDLDARGRPKMMRAQVEARQLVIVAKQDATQGPNLSALQLLTKRNKQA